MQSFINDNFILPTATSRELYHAHASNMPIIDFHNHLNPQDIYEDRHYDNLSQLWLGGDHYKWRAMRANGIPEELVTGNSDPYEKFLAWADTVKNCIGNPLYHWTHLELKRYFDIDLTLSPDTAKEIWNACNALLKTPEYSVRGLLKMQNVEVLCTTDDPADDLKWHKKIKEKGIGIKVLPSFRPGRALDISDKDFPSYISHLGIVSGVDMYDLKSVILALNIRLQYFIENGCRTTDHSLEGDFYQTADYGQANAVYQKRLNGSSLSRNEQAMYQGYLLTELGKMYAQQSLTMQLHIGAIRNNSSRLFQIIGADAGFDSLHDFHYAPQLAALLDSMDQTNELPRTILYYLNPKDAEMLATMAGNFQSNTEGIRGKIQLGSAWWFCDHKHGIEHQLQTLSDVGLLSSFIGMLTDSRSFLSFPRHEYFRRILCGKIGALIENGEYPNNMEYLGMLIENICYYNAKLYFNL